MKVQFILKDKMPWADKDFVMAEEQVLVKEATDRPLISEVAAATAGSLKSRMNPSTERIEIKGDGFEAEFDQQTGSIYSLKYGDKQLLRPEMDRNLMHFVPLQTMITGSMLLGLNMVCITCNINDRGNSS